jgi:hypothetical protein
VAVVPDAGGWRLAAEIGCSRGCSESDIWWWHLWRNGNLPPPPAPGPRQRRYAEAALNRILSELPGRPDATRLRRAAYDAGRFLQAADLDPYPVADALVAAADRAGIEDINPLIAAMAAGRSDPVRLPQ